MHTPLFPQFRARFANLAIASTKSANTACSNWIYCSPRGCLRACSLKPMRALQS
jgi:hypothetical protein